MKRVIVRVTLQEADRMGGTQMEEPKTSWLATKDVSFAEGAAGIEVLRGGQIVKTVPYASVRSYEWGSA